MVKTNSTISTIGVLETTTQRTGVTLLALNWLTSEDSLQYYKDISQGSTAESDMPHNLETLFEELRTIHSMLFEELVELRDHHAKLIKEL